MVKKTNQEKLQDSNRKSKQIFKRPVQSTQQNIPIRDIINGVILTKDYRYIKVMEIKPISFDMKSYADQTNIFNQFLSVLKVCPSTLQLTAMCLPANLKKQLDVLEYERNLESNPGLLKVYDAYRDRLLETERTRFTRRFFLSFQYEGRKTSDISQIIFELNRQEQIIAAQLANCGNEVVSFNAETSSVCKVFAGKIAVASEEGISLFRPSGKKILFRDENENDYGMTGVLKIGVGRFTFYNGLLIKVEEE